MSDDVLAAIATLSERIADLAARSDRLESGLDGLRQDTAQLRQDVTHRIDRLQSGLDRVRGDVMERIDRLQITVGGLRDDTQVNYASHGRVEETVRHAVAQTRLLADQVTAMEKQILGLSARVAELESKED